MTPDEYANKWDLAWKRIAEFREDSAELEIIAFFKENIHLTEFDRGRILSEMGRATCAGKVRMMQLWDQMKRENVVLPPDPEDGIRKTTNREEANKLIEEIDTLTPETPAEVVDDMLRRTRDFSPLKVETLLALMTMRIGNPRSNLYARRRAVLHSTSPAMTADYTGIEARILLMDEAQNWPTQRDGDTITHGSVTGRSTSPLSDRAAVITSHVDSIDLCFNAWWLEYLREWDYVTQGSAVGKIKAAFRAGYIRGVKDAKKDGA